jgi:hypothetical protein
MKVRTGEGETENGNILSAVAKIFTYFTVNGFEF